MSISSVEVCPCGSMKPYTNCCAAFIAGEKLPTTPEQLMRSRYTAYTLADVDYVARTMRGAALQDFDAEHTRKWLEFVEWIGLEVVAASSIAAEDKQGTVEFIARYRVQGREQHIHEVSEFQHDGERWFYVDGKAGRSRKAVKVGRNEVCTCGSGKKYKKCCGAGL